MEATEDEIEEAESDIEYTDESMYSPTPTSREQKSKPHRRTKSNHRGTLQNGPARNKTQSTGPALIRASRERSIKKPHSETRKNRSSILTTDSSSSGKHRVKRRSSYHVNEKGSPMQNPSPSSPQIRRPVKKKRKVEFDDDSESMEQELVAVKKRSKSRKHR